MKLILVAVVGGAVVASAAQAGSHNPAIKNDTAIATPIAAKGANSFTESQARGRIAKAGYTNVTQLVKNPNGVWQGSAVKNGKPVLIGLDYKGNVIIR